MASPMSFDDIPPDVRQLIGERVESYEHLETLILLRRQPDRLWTPSVLAAELRIPEETSAAVLASLSAAGLVRTSPDSPGDHVSIHPDAMALIERLVIAHADHRLDVMTLMTASALKRVRTSALRAFASAFLLGGKRDG